MAIPLPVKCPLCGAFTGRTLKSWDEESQDRGYILMTHSWLGDCVAELNRKIEELERTGPEAEQ